MNDDPFLTPTAAFVRPSGHDLLQPKAKRAHLILPLAAVMRPQL